MNIIQQAMEQLEGQGFPSCETKNERFFLLSLWKFLQRLSEQYPSLLLLPCIERGKWKCEAILLSHRGIYVFHLLPINVIEIEINPSGIRAFCSDRVNKDEWDDHPTEEILYLFGNSRMMLDDIQHQYDGSPLPVYEFYIASEQHQDLRCVVVGGLIISISQLDDLFSHYEFRPDPIHDNRQKELYYCLTQSIKEADLEIKQHLRDEMVYSTKVNELSAFPDSPFPMQAEPRNTLPPRQSRKKKHSHSWLTKFFK